MGKPTKVKSPCKGHCKVSKKSGLCKGCKRTLDEIACWATLSNKKCKKLLLVLETR